MAIAKKRTVKKSAESIRKKSAKKGISAKDAWDVFTIDLSGLLDEISKNINAKPKKKAAKKSARKSTSKVVRKSSTARKSASRKKLVAKKSSRSKVRA